ncbi:hypothetical protein Leryth_003174 [Lithospermum erythrorhizon]|nr:hypothetical protein Leryth_003174 [Lithospermum erythrorhizon]
MRFLAILFLFYFVSFAQCYEGIMFDLLYNARTSMQEKRPMNIDEYGNNNNNNEAEYEAVYVGPQDGLKEADKIVALPGQPEVFFDQYSGYVTVDPNDEKALFYYFVESDNSSSTKPLVLWINGGPACSSLGNGAMMELGPFRVNKDNKTLWLNKFAWNNVANIIFLESPIGVGFSYSNKSTDYTSGDEQTAAESYTFLINWLERFPEYKARDFFIAGESYAGHYIPQLAQLILHNNKITNQAVINLKGIAIGNPYIDDETLYIGKYDYLWSHALISDEIHKGIVLNCNFSSPEPLSDECNKYLSRAEKARGNIFYYDIYAPLCDVPSNPDSGFDPCTDQYIFSYLNNREVQKSLHVNVTGQLPGTWMVCNYDMLVSWKDRHHTVLPTIMNLLSSGIRVWLYSGDTDLQVPVTSTRYAIKKLGVTLKTPWTHWDSQGEVSGYVVEYQNLTFATVRGSGHYVPSYQPARALELCSSFLNGRFLSQYS